MVHHPSMNTPEPAPAFRLYVIGQSSPHPGDWSEWASTTLVLARTAEEAARLCGGKEALLLEVDEPTYLTTIEASEDRFLDL